MSNVGERLKNARIKKHLTIDDVVNQINIRSFYLKAMESNRFDELPEGDAYRKAFIKNYAEVLEVDKEEIVSLYSRLQIQTEQREKDKEDETDKNIPKRLDVNRAPLVWGGALILLIAAVFGGFRYFTNAQDSTSLTKAVSNDTGLRLASNIEGVSSNHLPKEDVVSPKKSDQEEALVAPPVLKRGVGDTSKTPKALLVLKARAVNDVEFKLKIDEEIPLTITLKKGEIKKWPAQEKFILNLPDAGGVEWTLNDHAPHILGQKGQNLENIVFTRS